MYVLFSSSSSLSSLTTISISSSSMSTSISSQSISSQSISSQSTFTLSTSILIPSSMFIPPPSIHVPCFPHSGKCDNCEISENLSNLSLFPRF
ncbi:MAG TPA: hypothetical protein VMS35_03940 [Nitrososphaeraceae archaeon]|nr:hypothetical protein [Nitrososphaeraceae archaeon]